METIKKCRWTICNSFFFIWNIGKDCPWFSKICHLQLKLDKKLELWDELELENHQWLWLYSELLNWTKVNIFFHFFSCRQRCTLFQTIQMKLILLCVWAEPAVLGSTKTALKIQIWNLNRLTHIQFNVWGRV